LWTSICQLFFPLRMIDVDLAKLPQARDINSPASTETHLKPQLLSPSIGVQGRTVTTLEEVRVDMADMKVESRPVVLVTNVGSCVAICIHDPVNKCGGMVHIMLPSSSITKNKSFPLKYADTAVLALLDAVRKASRHSHYLTAKIAGGANMFPNLKANVLNIGEKNVEAVKRALEEYGVKLLAEDVKGTSGRKVIFNISNGAVLVHKGNGEVTEL